MKSRLSKLFIFAVLATMLTVLLTGCGGGGEKKEAAKPAGDKKFLNIATGGTAGTYYPLGGAMAEILNKAIPGMNASAQSTGASTANVNMLKDGSVDLAIIQNDTAYYATNGIEMFKDKKVANLQGIATLYPETCQIITLKKSGITDLSQAKGKRVAVGAAGSGTEANARQILEGYGVNYKDITVQYLSFGEASNALKDGNVDIAFVTAGFPTAAIQDISSQHEIQLLPVSEAVADKLIAKYPFYTKTVIPKGTYAKYPTDTAAVSVMAMLACSDKMKPEMAYDVTKAIFSNLDRIKAAHSVGKLITKEGAQKGMPIKLNAGAEKFFKEK